jgi:hypothetical protein
MYIDPETLLLELLGPKAIALVFHLLIAWKNDWFCQLFLLFLQPVLPVSGSNRHYNFSMAWFNQILRYHFQTRQLPTIEKGWWWASMIDLDASYGRSLNNWSVRSQSSVLALDRTACIRASTLSLWGHKYPWPDRSWEELPKCTHSSVLMWGGMHEEIQLQANWVNYK